MDLKNKVPSFVIRSKGKYNRRLVVPKRNYFQN